MEEILERLDEIRDLTLLGAKNVLTIRECSMLTGLSVARIYRLTSTRQIPFHKPNGSRMLYFDKQELEEWLLRNRVAPICEAEEKAAARAARKEILP